MEIIPVWIHKNIYSLFFCIYVYDRFLTGAASMAIFTGIITTIV